MTEPTTTTPELFFTAIRVRRARPDTVDSLPDKTRLTIDAHRRAGALMVEVMAGGTPVAVCEVLAAPSGVVTCGVLWKHHVARDTDTRLVDAVLSAVRLAPVAQGLPREARAA